MKDIAEIQLNLHQFTGTEGYTRLSPNAVLTDGARYLAEAAECFWLFQDSAIFMRGYEKRDEFAVIRLELLGESGKFQVLLGDGNGTWRVLFGGEFTSFPVELMPFEFYAQWNHELRAWVFLLKSEY